MGFTTALIALAVIVLLNIIVNRIATAALTFTGMSREMARFQARSAFSLCGFTTDEAESVVGHPVRRQIIGMLMFFGSVGFVGMVAAVLGAFTGQGDVPPGVRVGTLLVLTGVLFALGMSRWVDDMMFRAISWSLRRFTRLEVHDFVNLLQFGAGYNVTEVLLEPEDWLVGHRLDELRLTETGVNVLGIHRTDGEFVGTPSGNTYLRRGDRLIVYGARERILALDERKGKEEEGRKHRAAVEERRALWQGQAGAPGEDHRVTELVVRQKSWLVNRSLKGAALAEAGVLVLAIKRIGGTFISTPPGDMRLQGEDTLVVYGANQDLEAFHGTIRDAEGEKKHQDNIARRKAATAGQTA